MYTIFYIFYFLHKSVVHNAKVRKNYTFKLYVGKSKPTASSDFRDLPTQGSRFKPMY